MIAAAAYAQPVVSVDPALEMCIRDSEHTVAVRVWDGNDNLAVDKVVVK